MIPITVTTIEIMRHLRLLDIKIVLAESLAFNNARYSVCNLDACSSQKLYLARIVCLQQAHVDRHAFLEKYTVHYACVRAGMTVMCMQSSTCGGLQDVACLQGDNAKVWQGTASDHELDASYPQICQDVGDGCVFSAVVW